MQARAPAGRAAAPAPTGGRAATPATAPGGPRRPTRSGWRRPTSSATRPPRLLPTRCGRSTPARRAARRPRRRSSGDRRPRATRLVGVAEARKVRRDHAEPAGERCHRGRKRPLGAAEPVEGEDRRAAPASIVETRARRVAIVRNRSRAGSVAPLVAARKPTAEVRTRRTPGGPRGGGHPAADVLGDRPPRRRVGRQHGVGGRPRPARAARRRRRARHPTPRHR